MLELGIPTGCFSVNELDEQSLLGRKRVEIVLIQSFVVSDMNCLISLTLGKISRLFS